MIHQIGFMVGMCMAQILFGYMMETDIVLYLAIVHLKRWEQVLAGLMV